MLLKRKRSESELSFSSAFSSPPRPGSSSFDFGAMTMDTDNHHLRAWRSATPAHLPSRTMKRFRDNRPSQAEVHQHTLGLLYSAQQQQEHGQPLASPEPQIQPLVVPEATCTAAGPRGACQRSLHSFWKLPGSALAATASALPSSAAPSSSATLGVQQEIPANCEDCGAGLGGDDAMDLDDSQGSHSCGACGKAVCFGCSGDAKALSSELEDNLSLVPETVEGSSLPVPGARVIIAPHAGYTYSGKCAAWAYKALDLAGVKRVFVLGPSHTYYLSGSALTTFAKYDTPLGGLTVDTATIQELRQTKRFTDIPKSSDNREHSLEMHFPYLYKRVQQTFGDDTASYPTVVPILIGDNNGAEEKAFGEILAPYVKDPANAFIVSSDFCHWGARFRYQAYVREKKEEVDEDEDEFPDVQWDPKVDPPIHEGIRLLDEMAMDAVQTGVHDTFVRVVNKTRNTVCGRHPIGVIMAALEAYRAGGAGETKGRFRFVQYQRSNLVKRPRDESVSYASAYAVL
ncbi:UPF0103-domain-containing protein [Thozetella sp. PMI_491]|nr:UPF0103-domain-containing protein [Thozetella sp. PMI_491]